jgi:hypothetical protein
MSQHNNNIVSEIESRALTIKVNTQADANRI